MAADGDYKINDCYFDILILLVNLIFRSANKHITISSIYFHIKHNPNQTRDRIKRYFNQNQNLHISYIINPLNYLTRILNQIKLFVFPFLLLFYQTLFNNEIKIFKNKSFNNQFLIKAINKSHSILEKLLTPKIQKQMLSLKDQEVEEEQKNQIKGKHSSEQIDLTQQKFKQERNNIPPLGYFIITHLTDNYDNQISQKHILFSYIVINQLKGGVAKVFTFNSKQQDESTLKQFMKTSLESISDYIKKDANELPIPVFQNDDTFSQFKGKLKDGYYDPIYTNYISIQKYISKEQAMVAVPGYKIDFLKLLKGHTEQSIQYISAILHLNKNRFYFTTHDTKANQKDKTFQSKKLIIKDKFSMSYKKEHIEQGLSKEYPIQKSTYQKQNLPQNSNKKSVVNLLNFNDRNQFQLEDLEKKSRIFNMMKELVQSESDDNEEDDNSNFDEYEDGQNDGQFDKDGFKIVQRSSELNKQPNQIQQDPLMEEQIVQNNKVLNFDEVQQMKNGMVSEYLNSSSINQDVIQKIDFKKSIDSFAKNAIIELKNTQKQQTQEFQRRQERERQQFLNMIQNLKEEFDKKQGNERNKFQKILNQEQADCQQFIVHHLSKVNKLQDHLNQYE